MAETGMYPPLQMDCPEIPAVGDSMDHRSSSQNTVPLLFPESEHVCSILVLHFEGFVRDKVQDWRTEKNRIHFVKVLYYLENHTMQITEPQGTMFNRDLYLHPSNVRNYHWKDLNIGNDVHIYGRTIHLFDCDSWTREFLTHQGIEVNDPEPKPENPILVERQLMEGRQEWRNVTSNESPLSQFYEYDNTVLQFYGIFKDDSVYPMAIRTVVLNFYPSDGTLQVIENWEPNSGRSPMMPHGRNVFVNNPCNIGLGSWLTIIKRQRILVDRERDTEKLPCYLEPKDEDDVTWISPKHLKTGEDIKILGKTFFLNKCNDFTKQFYRNHYGIDLPQMEVIPKPKLTTPTITELIEAIQFYKTEKVKDKECDDEIPSPKSHAILISHSETVGTRTIINVIKSMDVKNLHQMLQNLDFEYAVELLEIMCNLWKKKSELDLLECSATILIKMHLEKLLAENTYHHIILQLKDVLFKQKMPLETQSDMEKSSSSESSILKDTPIRYSGWRWVENEEQNDKIADSFEADVNSYFPELSSSSSSIDDETKTEHHNLKDADTYEEDVKCSMCNYQKNPEDGTDFIRAQCGHLYCRRCSNWLFSRRNPVKPHICFTCGVIIKKLLNQPLF